MAIYVTGDVHGRAEYGSSRFAFRSWPLGRTLTETVAASNLIILTPSEKPAAETARAKGARINPPLEVLTEAAVIVLALVAVGGMTMVVKEKWWTEAYFSAPLETAVLASKPWLPSEIAKRIHFR